MKIVVTDGFTLNPGDLDWEGVKQFGDATIYDRTSSDQLVERCRDAELIITNKTPLSKDIIQQLPSLKLICVTATGYNIVDTTAARERNIPVCNVPTYGTYSVAQHTFALILAITNHVAVHADSVQQGEWLKSPDFSYTKTPLTELAGKILGIIGMGNIGEQVGRIAIAMGMGVIYSSRHKKDISFATFVSKEDLFRHSDLISLHCPLTPDNKEFVNAGLLSLMKPGAWLINTARGPLINEQDLANALNSGRIGGAALDVLSVEPPKPGNPLLSAKNCLITPHIAWASKEARERLLKTTIENIQSFINGKPQHVVN